MEPVTGSAASTAMVATWVIYVEVVGALVGIALTVLLARIRMSLGGVVGTALNNLIVGVALFTVAFIAAAVLQALNVTAMENTMAVHMVLMILALIMIVLSARSLAGLIR